MNGVDYKPTHLAITEKLELDEYQELLASLGAITRGHQWWVGDALVYGENRYGEDTFSQAAEALRLEPHTLVNYRWVSASVPTSRRRVKLTWSHHAEVARLEPKQQTEMLREAEKRGWGVRELREACAIRHPQPGKSAAAAGEPAAPLSDADQALMNRRLEGIAAALDAANADQENWHTHLDLDDVRWLHRACVELLRHGKR